ncbi:MAG: T9SS type A sorting domain-containing protein [Bacteroidota bacterium]
MRFFYAILLVIFAGATASAQQLIRMDSMKLVWSHGTIEKTIDNPDGFELLAGDGSIRPVFYFTNVSGAEIENAAFRVQFFNIRSQRLVYNRNLCADKFGASEPGEIAVRFICQPNDTIRAIDIYFSELPDAPDEVDVRFYVTDSTGMPGTDDDYLMREMTIRRGDDNGEYKFGAYVSYPIDPPLVITEDENEDIWVALGQRGAASFGLGAASFGTGMVTTSISDDPAKIVCAPIATDYNSFRGIAGRRTGVRGDFHNYYAYRNEGGEWHSFMPETGLPAYPHLDAEGNINGVKTYAQGTWIPMIRLPFIGSTEVGVAEETARDLNIYPNPSRGAFTLSMDAAPGRYEISICDELGRTLAMADVFDWGGGAIERNYDFGWLPAGAYYLRIKSGDDTFARKLMIIR